MLSGSGSDCLQPEEIVAFRALPLPAGESAQRWLHQRVTDGDVPLETHVARSSAGAVLGFYALEETRMRLAKDDSIKLRLRRLKPDARTQPGALVSWIARSQDTGDGFGAHIIDHAIINAREQGAVALVVTPHDRATEEMWCRRHHFMRFKDDPTAPHDTAARLWHPVHELAAGGWPS